MHEEAKAGHQAESSDRIGPITVASLLQCAQTIVSFTGHRWPSCLRSVAHDSNTLRNPHLTEACIKIGKSMESTPKYQATIDRSNRNNSHTLALDFIQSIKPAGLKILEVGCSTGYFGSHLRQLGHHVTGVELDPQSAALAQAALDEVHCISIEKFYAANSDRRFDVICFGDVLEHLYDPKDALERSIKQLAPDGHIICSVPNIGHGCIRGSLLEGEWNYSDLGILDRTHIRFFTKKTLLKLLQSVSLNVEKIQSVRLPILQAGDMCGIELKKETLSKILAIRNDATVDDFQYVVSAKPGKTDAQLPAEVLASQNPMKILVLCDHPPSTMTKIRIGIPMTDFADSACRELRIKDFGSAKIRDLLWGSVIVVQRGMTKKSSRLIQDAKALGKPIVYEIDDLLTELPDFLSHHKNCIANRHLIERNIRNATMVTVSNSRLKSALSHLNKNIQICPNYANPTFLSMPPNEMHTGSGPVNLFIGSSDRVRVDFLTPALKIIQEKYKDRVQIHCIGPLSEAVSDSGVNCTSTHLLGHAEFIQFLKKHANAVGVIPLDDSKFSSCKSAVKYFDYSQAGLAVACSKVSPYVDVIEHDRTGLLTPNTTEGWVDTMSRLIDSSDLRASLAMEAQKEIAAKHSLAHTSEAWRQVFEMLAPNGRVNTQPVPPLRLKARFHEFTDKIRDINQHRKLKRSINKTSQA